MLDHAANGAELWGLEEIRMAFQPRYQDADEAAEALAAFLRGAESEGRQAEVDFRRRRRTSGARGCRSSRRGASAIAP
jgi:hypothetical protein